MKRIALLLSLLFTLAGCRTALVFTGTVETIDEREALAVASALESDLKKEGFTANPLPHTQLPSGVARMSSWWNPRSSVLVEAITKKKEVSLRIVPQPGANNASKEVAERVRILLVTRFPNLKIQIIEKPEADFLR
jgi:hypothetical protein